MKLDMKVKEMVKIGGKTFEKIDDAYKANNKYV